jgi:hypothetical protein
MSIAWKTWWNNQEIEYWQSVETDKRNTKMYCYNVSHLNYRNHRVHNLLTHTWGIVVWYVTICRHLNTSGRNPGVDNFLKHTSESSMHRNLVSNLNYRNRRVDNLLAHTWGINAWYVTLSKNLNTTSRNNWVLNLLVRKWTNKLVLYQFWRHLIKNFKNVGAINL